MAKASKSGTSSKEKSASPVRRALWTPQPGPQANAICADWCPILFYGGGKFSGKSDFLLGDYLQDLPIYREHWQGVIFRRALTEFTELKLRANELFPKIGGEWYQQASEWRFPRYGTKDQVPILRFRYLESLDDIRLYEGHSYPWIGVDELGDWERPEPFFRLLTCNRYGRHPIPNKRLRATGNPGGRGHVWIKKYFVDPAPQGSVILHDKELDMNYMFILGTYRDNKIGMMNDPGYDKRMNRAGSPELVRALKEGDFSITAGAYYPELSEAHKIDPFDIPKWWPRIRGLDWGACGEGDPFCYALAAVADSSMGQFTKGDLIFYRCWHGAGLPKTLASTVAKGILERERGEPPIHLSYAGGDIENQTGIGTSIWDTFRDNGLIFQRADRRRIHGAQEVRERLVGQNFKPNIWFVRGECDPIFECLQTLQHDPKNMNDCIQKNDDPYDCARYIVMSRVYSKDAPPAPINKLLPPKLTPDNLWAELDRRRY